MGSRPFRLLFAGQAISAVGNRLVPVALAFAVLDLTGSVSDLGIVLAAQTIPLIVFVLLGGVWADRLVRQRVMLASDCVRAVTQGASAALLLTGDRWRRCRSDRAWRGRWPPRSASRARCMGPPGCSSC